MTIRTEHSLTNWQWQTRPLMIGMLVSLALFFFLASFYQLFALNRKIDQSPQIDVTVLLGQDVCLECVPADACLQLRRLRLAVSMEANIVARRHHQANVMLMAGIWSRYLAFVTGMTLAMVGAVFILGQLRDRGTKIEGSSATIKASLTSASPGLVLVALGVVVMITTIITVQHLGTRDAAIYFVGDGSLDASSIGGGADSQAANPIPAPVPK